MDKNRKAIWKRLWRLLPALLLMGLIFYFSAEDATASAQSSGNTMLWLLRLFHVSATDAIVESRRILACGPRAPTPLWRTASYIPCSISVSARARISPSTPRLGSFSRSHGRHIRRFRNGNAQPTRSSVGSSTRQAMSCTSILFPAEHVRCATCASIPRGYCSAAEYSHCSTGYAPGTGKKRTAPRGCTEKPASMALGRRSSRESSYFSAAVHSIADLTWI